MTYTGLLNVQHSKSLSEHKFNIILLQLISISFWKCKSSYITRGAGSSNNNNLHFNVPTHILILKAAVRKFCLFVAISVWKPGIAVSCGIILFAWAVFWHSFSADESNVLRWMCCCQSPHRCGCLLYFTITDSSLRLGIYDPNNNFHRILPSEQVSNKSATFVLPNWGKKYYNKSRYQWWLYLTIG